MASKAWIAIAALLLHASATGVYLSVSNQGLIGNEVTVLMLSLFTSVGLTIAGFVARQLWIIPATWTITAANFIAIQWSGAMAAV